jgi:hypothetical protein
MAKFAFGTPAVKRVTAGGDFNEDWFDLRDTLSQGDVVASSASVNDMERGARLAFALLHAWSVTDGATGQPVPVTYDNFMKLPMTMVQPVYNAISSADFLAQK